MKSKPVLKNIFLLNRFFQLCYVIDTELSLTLIYSVISLSEHLHMVLSLIGKRLDFSFSY